jgi:hypothetical protein
LARGAIICSTAWQVLANTCGTTVNPATLAQPRIGLPYVQLLSASPSGSCTFSLFAGALPPGVQLTNVAGIYSLAGIPTTGHVQLHHQGLECHGQRRLGTGAWSDLD